MGCEKGGQWPEALSLLREMGDVKLEPSVITYSAGISACEKGRQWPEALSLLREIGDVKLEPNVIQCWNQRVRERRAVARGIVAVQGNGGRETGAELHHVQWWN